MERLQKFMARCGIASRRKSEELIQQGRVKVNDIIVTEMGFKVTGNDTVKVDNVVIQIEDLKYYVINKPRYCICSSNDEKDRETVLDLLPKELKEYRLFSVGRLDYDTKGVLLLTNDGEFMNILTGPGSHVEKEYLARLDRIISEDDLRKISKGVKIDNYLTKKCKTYLESIDKKNNSCLVKIIVTEGKYHQVKRMFESVGYNVKRLTRTRFGNINCDELKEGMVRELTIHEVKLLKVSALKNE